MELDKLLLFALAHVLIGKPVSTFPEHALALMAFAIPIGFPDVGSNWIGRIGIVPLLTGLVGNCPAYSVMGLSSCSKTAAGQG